MGGAQRRHHHRVQIERHQPQAEAKERRLRIAQRAGLGVEVVLEHMKGGLDAPAGAVELHHRHGIGHLAGQIGEHHQRGIAIARGGGQLHADTAQPRAPAGRIGDLNIVDPENRTAV
jgi:hypothetical protein